MEFRQLQLFIALAEEGSFTKAAQRMNIVQSGLSISVKELESEIGTKLFNRTTRKVELTSAGSLFLEHARAGLRALDEGVQAVRSQDGIVRGRLHLGILQSLEPYLRLPLLLQRFRSAYPEVEFAVRALENDSIPARIRSGDLDVSFHAVVNKPEWPGLRVIPYTQDSFVAICSRGHRFASMQSISLQALVQENFVDLTSERALRKLVDRAFAAHHLERKTVYEVSDVQAAFQLVGEGLGVAVMPSVLAQSSADSRHIRLIRIKDQTPPLPQWQIAILTRLRQDVPRGKSTVDLFLETLRNLPSPNESA
jgi:DNA-binding transcriptional LysR family regulator